MAVTEILIGGTDYADRALFSTCKFTSQVNGYPGEGYVRLRDPDRTIEIPVGTQIVVKVDSEVVWRGFVMMWERVFVFPAINVDAFGETRFFDIKGPDINVLFSKRIIFNQADPEVVEGKLYGPDTADNTIIADVIADYIDLSSDTIDTSTFVDNVGDSVVGQEGRAWSAGDTWGQTMQSIASLPAAIYYLYPTASGANLVYCDVDTPSAPYVMSDVLDPIGGPLSDDFDRTVGLNTDGWGSGGLGEWYAVDGSFTDGYSVTPGAAFMHRTGWLATDIAPTVPATQTTRFRWPASTPDGNTIGQDFGGVPGDFDDDKWVETYLDDIGFFELFTLIGDDSIAVSPGVAGEWWTMVLQVNADGSSQAKAWPDSEADPGWQLFNAAGSFDVSALSSQDIYTNSNTTGDLWEFDGVEVDDGTTAIYPAGYREMGILFDGTALVNDQLAWGIGYGDNVPVFVRDEDSASQVLHGLWQAGKVIYGVHTQATINRNAASIVDGSPQSKRGHKNDAVAVTLSTYQTGFLPSQKVDFTSEVWGFNDVIPIRKMTVTFEAPDNPKFDLVLSHEIDAPMNLIDNYFFDFTFPPFQPEWPPPWPPFPGPGDCSDAVCGITDTFTRTESGTWGVADCGLVWRTSPVGTGGTISVDGDAGVIFLDTTTNRGMLLGGSGGIPQQVPVDLSVKSMRFQIPDFAPLGTINSYVLIWTAMDHPGFVVGPTLGISANDTGASPRSFIDYTTAHFAGNGDIPGSFWDSSKTYTWTVFQTATGQGQAITDGTTTYGFGDGLDWPASGSDPTVAMCSLTLDFNSGTADDITFRVLEIDIPEITRCTLNEFDLFDRAVSPDSWGTSTDGHPWTTSLAAAGATVDVSGGLGRIQQAAGTSNEARVQTTDGDSGGWNEPAWTMTTRVQLDFGALGGDTFLGTVNPADLRSNTIQLSPQLDQILFSDGTNASFNFISGTEYNVKWEMVSWVGEDRTMRARIWEVGDPEPSTWDIQTTVTGGQPQTSSNRFFVYTKNNSGVNAYDTYFSYINFDYAGKSCYSAYCPDGPGMIDDFNRFETDTLGTASVGTAYSGYGGEEALWSVDGNKGIGSPNEGLSTWANTIQADLVYPVDIPWGFTFETGFSEPNDWVVTANNTVLSVVSQIEFDLGGSTTSVSLLVNSFQVGGVFGNNIFLRLEIDSVDATSAVAVNTLVEAGRLYQINVVKTGSGWFAECPDLGLTTSIVASSLGTSVAAWQLVAAMGQSGTGIPSPMDHPLVYFDNFQPLTQCVRLPGTTSLPASPNGYGCEDAESLGGGVYRVTGQMAAGTSKVFINGLRQRRGGLLDYTEDPANGEIVFNGPEFPEEDDVVRVCYYTAGPL